MNGLILSRSWNIYIDFSMEISVLRSWGLTMWFKTSPPISCGCSRCRCVSPRLAHKLINRFCKKFKKAPSFDKTFLHNLRVGVWGDKTNCNERFDTPIMEIGEDVVAGHCFEGMLCFSPHFIRTLPSLHRLTHLNKP